MSRSGDNLVGIIYVTFDNVDTVNDLKNNFLGSELK